VQCVVTFERGAADTEAAGRGRHTCSSRRD
jgi:hypothetical protein